MHAKVKLVALAAAATLLMGASCGGSDSSSPTTGGHPPDPYAAVPAQELALTMLADLGTIPGPPSGTTCAPDESHCAHVYVFNKAGQLIAEQYRSFGLAVSETRLMTYDAAGRLQQVAYTFDPASPTTATETYQYDAQSRVTRKLSSYPGGSSRETVYVYSGNVANVTATGRNAAGTVTSTWTGTFTYGSAGELLSVASATYTKSYTYSGGLLTDMRDTGGALYREHYTYNAQRNLIRVETDYAPADGLIDDVRMYTYKTMDLTRDGVVDVNIGYNVVGTGAQTAVGASDGSYRTPAYDTSGGLNWEGHDTGTCSTCGDMQGQINEILLGF